MIHAGISIAACHLRLELMKSRRQRPSQAQPVYLSLPSKRRRVPASLYVSATKPAALGIMSQDSVKNFRVSIKT